MKEELLNIGFKEWERGWFRFEADKFYIEFSPFGDPYFFIYTYMSGDRESAPHPYYNIEKLKILITAYTEYFK